MEPDEITRLILGWQSGDQLAESALFDKLYDRLHAIASNLVRHEPASRTLGPTALVHEAYVRFCGSHQLNISNRGHFLALAARVMRRILVDRARARKAAKRDGGLELNRDLEWFPSEADMEEVIAVDQALDQLQRLAPRQCRLVELRYFGGYTIEECASVLHISPRQIKREWDIARVRLREAMDGPKLGN
jgi:RNA polymerase sigma factor (TIGR02999 family)